MTAERRARREPGVFHFAFASWRAAPERGPGVFSVHERSAYGSVVVGLLLMLAVELFPVHVLLSRWSPLAAWAVTALSVYSGLWLIADWRATRLRPIRLLDGALELQAGLRWSAQLPLEAIDSIERPGRDAQDAPKPVRMMPFGDPDLIVRLRRPVPVRGPYGITRPAARIALSVDEPGRLLEAWEAARPAPGGPPHGAAS